MHVLEIGPANGHLLPELFWRANDLHIEGIDISKTTIDEACRFNADGVAFWQIAFHSARAARIPAASARLVPPERLVHELFERPWAGGSES